MKARADLTTSGCSSAKSYRQALGKRYRAKRAFSDSSFFEKMMRFLHFLLFSYLLTMENIDAPHLMAAVLVIVVMATAMTTAKEHKRIKGKGKFLGGEAGFSAEVGGDHLRKRRR
jgi:hypothetical protein